MKRSISKTFWSAGYALLMFGILAVQPANAQDEECPTSLEVTKTAFVRGSAVVGEITIRNVGECEAIIGGIRDFLEVHFPGKVVPPPLPPGSTPNWFFVAPIPLANPGNIPVGGQVTIPYFRCLCFARQDYTGANSMRNFVRVLLVNKPSGAKSNIYETRSDSFVPPEVCRFGDRPIDLDGIASTGSGGLADWDAGVCAGSPLTRFGFLPHNGEGIDIFDNDLNGDWTFGPGGDDLHLEGPTSCPTAFRNASHDLGFDCKVLDIDASLFTGQPVTCDLEFQIPFVSPCPPKVVFHDANGDGAYDNGEDIIYDSNSDGILD